MTFMPDTDTCIRYFTRRNAGVVQRMTSADPRTICLCDVVKAELYYGAFKSERREQNLALYDAFFAQFESLPFDSAAAREYGRLRASLAAAGTPIGPNDLLIAAIAVTHDVILVTHNTREFSRIRGPRLEDWET